MIIIRWVPLEILFKGWRSTLKLLGDLIGIEDGMSICEQNGGKIVEACGSLENSIDVGEIKGGPQPCDVCKAPFHRLTDLGHLIIPALLIR
jgi:hypothetical protein